MISTLEQIGNYRIEKEVGRGATSEVWLAHHAYLEQRKVAVKFLLTQDEETVERFSREANLISSLHHPNIVEIYDHGYTAPYFYSVLEYIPGYTLQHLLDRVRRLEFVDALEIFKQIASALDYAHSHNIIHRDVSPGNVLVEEETGRALLSDFGIARDLRRNITVDSRIMGTPGFWSPEHARSATEVTALSDIFGLGVILYVMLSGEMPWDEIPVLPGQSFGPPIPIVQRGVKNLPGNVERVLQTMMAIDPAKRYLKAQAAVEELERIAKRHHAITQSNTNNNGPEDELTTDAPFSCKISGVEQNEVETVLGADLVRAPISQAYERARNLCRPSSIAQVFDSWAAGGFRGGIFRQKMLGRLARLHEVSSRNVYFYTLQVLYEQRGEPQEVEEPDHEARSFPLEPEIDRWKVSLPQVTSFQENPGDQVYLPGSARVASCESCEGKGKIICKRCKGKGRIVETRTIPPPPATETTPAGAAKNESRSRGNTQHQPRAASSRPSKQPQKQTHKGQQKQPEEARTSEQSQPRKERVLVPCPECEGRGGIPCERCAGTGRLVKYKALRWQRTTHTLTGNDSLSFLRDEKWLRRSCAIHEIYREQAIGDAQNNAPAFHPEWYQIPAIRLLIQKAQAAAPNPDEARIVLSELTIGMVPVTDMVFDLGDTESPDGLYRVPICGFENAIPPDWRLLDWERVVFFWAMVFILVVAVVFGFFAFVPCL